jgi:dienelactone hydrolase
LPNPAFADEPVVVRLSGVKPGAKVALSATVRDDAGQVWASTGVYIATSEGTVDTGAQESIGGSYRGTDATGLFWSMALQADAGATRATFCKNGAQPDCVTVTAEVDGNRVASAEMERRWLAPDTQSRELAADGMVGWLYIPPGRERRRVVIVLGGSGGGYDLDKAALLSRHGFATLALAYFGVPPLPEWLHRVPLEYFGRAIEWLGAQEELEASNVGVLGVSRGAELALLIASRFPQVRAVAAYAPSAVAWDSGGHDRVTGEAIPCWTWDGRAIPSVPLPLRGFIARSAIPVGLLRRPVKFRNLFRRALRNRLAVEHAAIPAEQIRGPMLLISGGNDCVWPAQRMAETIVARLRSHGFTHGVEHVNYPRAGHSLRYPGIPTTARMARSRGVKFPIAFGGTASADAEAQADAWRRTIAFFEKNL